MSLISKFFSVGAATMASRVLGFVREASGRFKQADYRIVLGHLNTSLYRYFDIAHLRKTSILYEELHLGHSIELWVFRYAYNRICSSLAFFLPTLLEYI